MACWLFKSEPDVFSLEDLKVRPGRREPWNGVRNFQARNFLRDNMAVGDSGLFYHSSCPQPGVAGLVRVVGGAEPDPTQFDPRSEFFDPKSLPSAPRWVQVTVEWVADFPRFVPLADLRQESRLAGLAILRRGNRLSITPVDPAHFGLICRMGGLSHAPGNP